MIVPGYCCWDQPCLAKHAWNWPRLTHMLTFVCLDMLWQAKTAHSCGGALEHVQTQTHTHAHTYTPMHILYNVQVTHSRTCLMKTRMWQRCALPTVAEMYCWEDQVIFEYGLKLWNIVPVSVSTTFHNSIVQDYTIIPTYQSSLQSQACHAEKFDGGGNTPV